MINKINITPEQLAKLFHEIYEKKAAGAGWDTQESCKTKFEDLPEKNKETMIGTCKEILYILEWRLL